MDPERQGPEILTSEQRLARLGLTPESLRDSDVLVLHGGNSMLEGGEGVLGAKLVSELNPDDSPFDEGELPYAPGRFDWVLSDHGLLHQGSGDDVSTALLCEALNVCKNGGEIRIYDAFSGYTYKDLDELPDNISYWLQNKTGYRVDATNVVADGQAKPYLKLVKKQSSA